MGDVSNRLNRRWGLVIIGVLTNMSLGTVYSWSVFREPLVQGYGFSTAQTGIPYSVFLTLFAFTMPLGGWLQGRIGTRRTLALGAVCVALGWIVAGFVSTSGGLTFTYGVIAGFGVGLAYGVPLTVVGSWFPDRRGLALGLTLGGFGLSPFITAPMAEALITHTGVAVTFRVLGAGIFVILMAATVVMQRAPLASDDRQKNDVDTNVAPLQMLRDRRFYGLWITFGLGTFAGLTAIGMSAAYGIEVIGLSPAGAAVAVAGFGVMNGIGRPFYGWLTDHIGPRRTIVVSFVVIAIGAVFALIAKGGSVFAFMIGFGLLWLLLGGWLAIAPTTTTAYFGSLHYPANYGIMYTAYGVGALSGGVVSGYLTAMSGTLATTFWAVIATAVIGIALAFWLIPPRATKS